MIHLCPNTMDQQNAQKPRLLKPMTMPPPSPRQPPIFTTTNPHMTHNKNPPPPPPPLQQTPPLPPWTHKKESKNQIKIIAKSKSKRWPIIKKKIYTKETHLCHNPHLPRPTHLCHNPPLPRHIHLCHDPLISPLQSPPQTSYHCTLREIENGRRRDRDWECRLKERKRENQRKKWDMERERDRVGGVRQKVGGERIN